MTSNLKFAKFTIPSSCFLSFLLPPPPPPKKWCILLMKWKTTKCIQLFRERLLEKSVNVHATTLKGTWVVFRSRLLGFRISRKYENTPLEGRGITGWMNYQLSRLIKIYYWLPGTQITFRECPITFVLFLFFFFRKPFLKEPYLTTNIDIIKRKKAEEIPSSLTQISY